MRNIRKIVELSMNASILPLSSIYYHSNYLDDIQIHSTQKQWVFMHLETSGGKIFQPIRLLVLLHLHFFSEHPLVVLLALWTLPVKL